MVMMALVVSIMLDKQSNKSLPAGIVSSVNNDCCPLTLTMEHFRTTLNLNFFFWEGTRKSHPKCLGAANCGLQSYQNPWQEHHHSSWYTLVLSISSTSALPPSSFSSCYKAQVIDISS